MQIILHTCECYMRQNLIVKSIRKTLLSNCFSSFAQLSSYKKKKSYWKIFTIAKFSNKIIVIFDVFTFLFWFKQSIQQLKKKIALINRQKRKVFERKLRCKQWNFLKKIFVKMTIDSVCVKIQKQYMSIPKFICQMHSRNIVWYRIAVEFSFQRLSKNDSHVNEINW